MFGGHDLWKVLRLGGVFLMAAPAEIGHIRELGSDRGRIAGVLGQRTVASLARHMRMLPGRPRLGLIVVAHHASLLTGVTDRARAHEIERPRPVMAIFAEVFGDDGGPQDQKKAHGGDENQCRANQVSPFMNQTTQRALLIERLSALLQDTYQKRYVGLSYNKTLFTDNLNGCSFSRPGCLGEYAQVWVKKACRNTVHLSLGLGSLSPASAPEVGGGFLTVSVAQKRSVSEWPAMRTGAARDVTSVNRALGVSLRDASFRQERRIDPQQRCRRD